MINKTKIKNILPKILLYYSTFLSTILIIGGFYTARSTKEIVSNLLFLPIVVFLWITLIQGRKKRKNQIIEKAIIEKSEVKSRPKRKKIVQEEN